MIDSPHFSEDEQIAQLVRSTIHQATQPDNRQLKQLMPPLPHRRPKQSLFQAWSRQVTAVCAAFIICLGLFGFYRSNQSAIWPGDTPTSIAVTATYTSEPTATESKEDIAATSTAKAAGSQTASLTATPVPQPTKIAALPAAAVVRP